MENTLEAKDCPKCGSELPLRFSTGRLVCKKCGWSDQLFRHSEDGTTLVLRIDHLVIQRAGGFLSPHKKGERVIPYKSILGIQFVPSKALSYGYLYLHLQGFKSNIGSMEAASHENSLIIQPPHLQEFEKARVILAEKLQEAHPDRTSEQVKCSNCGSTQLTASQKGYSYKKAVAGALLTGGIGLLAGGIGSKKIIITCLNCGHQWHPGNS